MYFPKVALTDRMADGTFYVRDRIGGVGGELFVKSPPCEEAMRRDDALVIES